MDQFMSTWLLTVSAQNYFITYNSIFCGWILDRLELLVGCEIFMEISPVILYLLGTIYIDTNFCENSEYKNICLSQKKKKPFQKIKQHHLNLNDRKFVTS